MSQVPLAPELLDALHRLSSLLDGDGALESTLDTVVELAVGTLRGCDGAGVTLQTDGKVHTAAASDEYTLEIRIGLVGIPLELHGSSVAGPSLPT